MVYRTRANGSAVALPSLGRTLSTCESPSRYHHRPHQVADGRPTFRSSARTVFDEGMGDPQRIEEARIRALSLEIARILRDQPERVISKARANARRWGWLSEPADQLPPYAADWLGLIDGPVDHIIALLEAPLSDDRANHLRSTSPFAGVISSERRHWLREHYRRANEAPQ